MRRSAAVRWSSVEADPRARVDRVVDARFAGRGHHRACTPWDWWRIVLARTVARSDTQSDLRGFRHRCENPLYHQFGPGYASHALYVAAHATTVALSQYQRDVQHHLEVGARRRQPFVERPIALEVDSAAGMIARFDAIEQLATGSLAARRINPADEPATGRHGQPCASQPHWPPGRSRPTGHSPTSRNRPIYSANTPIYSACSPSHPGARDSGPSSESRRSITMSRTHRQPPDSGRRAPPPSLPSRTLARRRLSTQESPPQHHGRHWS